MFGAVERVLKKVRLSNKSHTYTDVRATSHKSVTRGALLIDI